MPYEGGRTFQSPPSELLTPTEPELPAYDASAPMPLNDFVAITVEDSHQYRAVAAKLNALQAWVASELKAIEEANAAR